MVRIALSFTPSLLPGSILTTDSLTQMGLVLQPLSDQLSHLRLHLDNPSHRMPDIHAHALPNNRNQVLSSRRPSSDHDLLARRLHCTCCILDETGL
jgi:hypothetical protein